MSSSVMLRGTHRSEATFAYSMTAEERAAVDAVLKRHGVREGAIGTLSMKLGSASGLRLDGHRDADGSLHFFDSAAHSDAALELIYELAASGNLAIHGDDYFAVTSPEAGARATDGGDCAVVHSAQELAELIRNGNQG